jgi:hypothetical protein
MKNVAVLAPGVSVGIGTARLILRLREAQSQMA